MTDRACMVIVKDDHILMVRQTYRGQDIWTFPGGRVEAGETPEAAAIRETCEEVNLQVKITHLLSERERENGQGIYHCYQGEMQRGEVSLGNDPELKEVRWIPVLELINHPEVEKILPELRKNSSI